MFESLQKKIFCYYREIDMNINYKLSIKVSIWFKKGMVLFSFFNDFDQLKKILERKGTI
jgi:hypothetical protein